MELQRAELVFVPAPGMGHLVSTVEVAKHLLRHDHRLSITVIILKIPLDEKISAYVDSLSSATRINFITVLLYEQHEASQITSQGSVFFSLIQQRKHLVKEAVDEAVSRFGSGPDSTRLSGFVIDMFCTSMIDVANEFGVPTYLFYTSGAGFLAFQFYALQLADEQNVYTTTFKDSDELLDVPMLRHRYPAKLFPTVLLSAEWMHQIHSITRRFRETKGIMVNSFVELEPYAVDALTSDKTIPPLYPVGPLLNEDSHDSSNGNEDVMTWLDNQPHMSVVFLCFGSMGCFDAEQVAEIATALEGNGHRFLWALRRPPPKEESSLPPTEYENLEEVLPEGFLSRTATTGKVIGWAPQVAVLGHPAVGGFVSHCGWNSTLESLWSGVPVAAWPMYAEQQFNAFEIVVELGLGVEVRMDYRKEPPATGEANMIVKAAEIERAVEKLMEEESEVRKRVKEMKQKSGEVLREGGSSYSNLARFARDVMTATSL